MWLFSSSFIIFFGSVLDLGSLSSKRTCLLHQNVGPNCRAHLQCSWWSHCPLSYPLFLIPHQICSANDAFPLSSERWPSPQKFSDDIVTCFSSLLGGERPGRPEKSFLSLCVLLIESLPRTWYTSKIRYGKKQHPVVPKHPFGFEKKHTITLRRTCVILAHNYPAGRDFCFVFSSPPPSMSSHRPTNHLVSTLTFGFGPSSKNDASAFVTKTQFCLDASLLVASPDLHNVSICVFPSVIRTELVLSTNPTKIERSISVSVFSVEWVLVLRQ